MRRANFQEKEEDTQDAHGQEKTEKGVYTKFE
jgi:hypothetical protein